MNAALRLSRSLTRTVSVIRQKFNKAFSSRYLLLTNTTLSTLSSIGGDLLAQHYEVLSGEEGTFSLTRNLKVGFTGVLVGPMFHYWYLYLDKFLPGRTARIVFTKVFLDMTIAPPVYIFFYIGSLGLMDGDKLTKIKVDMIEKGKDLWLAECIVWPPASAIGFYVLPTKFRVLFESSLSLIVDGYYSYVRFRDMTRKPKQHEVSDDEFEKDEIKALRTMTATLAVQCDRGDSITRKIMKTSARKQNNRESMDVASDESNVTSDEDEHDSSDNYLCGYCQFRVADRAGKILGSDLGHS